MYIWITLLFQKTLETLTNNLTSHYWYLLILIPVVWNYMIINTIFHSYDIPSLFFYIFCLYLFLNKKYFLFYVIFAVATLNRESTCFISISIALLVSKFHSDHRFKDNFRKNLGLMRHLISQAILWSLIVLLISWIVRDSLGNPTRPHIPCRFLLLTCGMALLAGLFLIKKASSRTLDAS